MVEVQKSERPRAPEAPPIGDPLPYDEHQRTRFFAPFPALASVGYTPAG